MVNNSTNINKTNNHISLKECLSSDGQQFHPSTKQTITSHKTWSTITYQQNKQSHSRKECLNSDGQQFHPYQQNKQSHFT